MSSKCQVCIIWRQQILNYNEGVYSINARTKTRIFYIVVRADKAI